MEDLTIYKITIYIGTQLGSENSHSDIISLW